MKQNLHTSRGWKESFRDKKFRMDLFFTIAALVLVLFSFSRFLLFVEAREGVQLNDPLFLLFTAVDLNIPVFILIYGGLIAGLIVLSKSPQSLLAALQTYIVMVLFRMAAMYVVPLEPPIGTIDLQDPVVFMLGTGGTALTKDLFFSGHTASLFILFLNIKTKVRYAFLAACIIVAAMVVIQKTHYTIDVLAAFAFTYSAYMVVKYFNKEKYE